MAYRVFQTTWQALDLPEDDEPVAGTGVLDFSGGAAVTCQTDIKPYPASGPGCFTVKCVQCGAVVKLVTSGKTSDPRNITVACLPTPNGSQYLPDDDDAPTAA